MPAPSTPQPLDIIYTPALQSLREPIQACAAPMQGIALYLNEITAPDLDFMSDTLSFRMGLADDFQQPYQAYQIGWVSIILVVHSENPLDSLSAEDLLTIFTGQILNWEELGGADLDIQAWVYPVGDDLRQAFDQTVLGKNRLTSFARIAPDPAALITAVSDDPGAIGYLPAAWLQDSSQENILGNLKLLNLEPELKANLQQPILALTATEPTGPARSLLDCLQKTLQP